MRTVWQIISRTVFWSFERGSWPYDTLVAVILLFVFLTPRAWFHDRPHELAASTSNVQLIAEDPVSRVRTYRLAATALSPSKRSRNATPELERETHAILGRTVDDLRDSTFQVVRIDPGLASDGSVSYYDVSVHQ